MAGGGGSGSRGALARGGRAPGSGSSTAAAAAGSAALTPQLVLALRERAMRYLLWIEDEAPPAQLAALKRRALQQSPILVQQGSSLRSLAADGLLGGAARDLPAYLTSRDAGMAVSGGPVGYQAPGEPLPTPLCVRDTLAAEAAAGAGSAGAGSAAATAGHAAKRLRTEEGGSVGVEQQQAVAAGAAAGAAPGEKRRLGDSPAGDAAAGAAAGAAAQPPSHPPYVVLVNTARAHSTDAAALLRLHPLQAQEAGALCANFPTHDVTDEEEAAFPALSRPAHAATNYSDAQRRDVGRSGGNLMVMPSGGDASPYAVLYALASEREPASLVAAVQSGALLPPPVYSAGSSAHNALLGLPEVLAAAQARGVGVGAGGGAGAGAGASCAPPAMRFLVHIPTYAARILASVRGSGSSGSEGSEGSEGGGRRARRAWLQGGRRSRRSRRRRS